MSPSRPPPPPRGTRAARAATPRTPVHRLGPLGTGQPSGPPADNQTGLPRTPSGVHAPDAHDDTGTQDWNEFWDDSGKPKTTPEDPEDPARITTITKEDGKPPKEPDLDESTKVTTAAPVPLPSSPNDESKETGLGVLLPGDLPVDLGAAQPDTQRIDDPPSPADVPLDMRFDPEGEGTPGIMPPVPAPSPSADDDKK